MQRVINPYGPPSELDGADEDAGLSERGRRLVLTVMVAVGLGRLATLARLPQLLALDMRTLAWPLLCAVLCYQLYPGKRWSRLPP
jgi:hypothetical protein